MNACQKRYDVSVIIPTYNRAWIVREAIDSVIQQKTQDIEIIVVNDGSIDHTSGILNEYEDKIRVIDQPNKGVSAARNTGIRNSSGQFIAFLDSDDYWLPEKLSSQIRFFQMNPDAFIGQTQEIWIRNGIRIYPQKKHQKQSGYFFERSLEMCLISPSAVMLKRSLLDEVGLFDETLPACEDYDFWLRVTLNYPVFLIDEPLVVKRGGHDDQLSQQPLLDQYRIYAIQKVLQNQSLPFNQYQAAVRIFKKKCSIVAKGCEKRGKKNEAMYYWDLSESVK
ncbi:MAG: glycosyltransferase [Desulfobacterales bacterium]|nr:glycosyltransferase [Desulfobacterales bacterium]